MKKLFLLLLLIPLVSFGQNISKLEELNGFRELKLGSDIREYNFVEKANSQNTYYNWKSIIGGTVYFTSTTFRQSHTNSDTELYVIRKGTPNYQAMPAGDKIEKVFIETFENKIYEIKIVVHHRPSSDYFLLKSYRDAFGKPNIIDGLKKNFNEGVSNNDSYYDMWSGKNILLSIISIDDSKIWRGTKRRFYWVMYTEKGEIAQILSERKKKRDSIKKQKLIDDF
jgi:hypothetical protein